MNFIINIFLKMDNNINAIILAAGLGTRMMPLTKNIPKPLIRVNGKTLLENSINFLIELGCKNIFINSFYLSEQIESFVKNNKFKANINIIREKKLLDTGGAIKNILSYIDCKKFLILNSDVFWIKKNLKDVEKLINNYNKFKQSSLLLVNKKNAFGLKKNQGDFVINNEIIQRYKKDDDKLIFYAGCQILNTGVFNYFPTNKFSLNVIWDDLIKKEKLKGIIMKSDWFHVGDVEGLNIASKSNA